MQTLCQPIEEIDMTISDANEPEPYTPADAIRLSVEQFMAAAVSGATGVLGNLDRWSQRRVVAENLAKTNLMLEADDPVEHCYQNLVREIDTEAEMGVLLAHTSTASKMLRGMCEDRGVSGELHRQMHRIAPIVFPDEYAHSNVDLDLVWASVHAVYDRACLDATTSKLAIQHLLNCADSAADITQALRALFYPFYEEGFRRQVDLPSLLDDPETQDLFVIVAELMMRAGSYEERISLIQSRARC